MRHQLLISTICSAILLGIGIVSPNPFSVILGFLSGMSWALNLVAEYVTEERIPSPHE